MSTLRLKGAFSVAKAPDSQNEDCIAVDRARCRIALSDGASVSYDSRGWARVLTRRLVQDPIFTAAWLASAIAEFHGLHDRDALPWMQQAAFDQGSFATLLGLRHEPDAGHAVLLAIGDSMAAICDRDQIVRTWPYEHSTSFDRRPLLLSTEPFNNASFFTDDFFEHYLAEVNLSKLVDPVILLMTDALARWVVERCEDDAWDATPLTNMRSALMFKRFVDEEREYGRLRRDDTSLIILG